MCVCTYLHTHTNTPALDSSFRGMFPQFNQFCITRLLFCPHTRLWVSLSADSQSLGTQDAASCFVLRQPSSWRRYPVSRLNILPKGRFSPTQNLGCSVLWWVPFTATGFSRERSCLSAWEQNSSVLTLLDQLCWEQPRPAAIPFPLLLFSWLIPQLCLGHLTGPRSICISHLDEKSFPNVPVLPEFLISFSPGEAWIKESLACLWLGYL